MVMSDTSETRCMKLTDERQSVRAYEELSTTCTASENRFSSIWLSILSSLSMALGLEVVSAGDGITSSPKGERPISKYNSHFRRAHEFCRRNAIGHVHHGDVSCFGRIKFSIYSLKKKKTDLADDMQTMPQR